MSQPGALSDTRTIDRTLVHREALGEVFVTGSYRTDGDTYQATAQLPRSHAYFGDHLIRPSRYDPLLLLESCRQTALAGAHLHYGVPSDHKFVLTRLALQVTAPEALEIGETPGVLDMRVTTPDLRMRDGRVTGFDSTMSLAIDGQEIGRADVGLRFKSPSAYKKLRLDGRDGQPPPSSSAHEPEPPGLPLYPAYVGRTDPANVLLLGAQITGDQQASALLRIPGKHPSLFDHAQDHLPGMLLAEGARQLAVHLVLEKYGLSVAKMILTSIDATFSRFGELDQRTRLLATVEDASQRGVPVSVDVEQDAGPIAHLDCTLSPTAAWPLGMSPGEPS
jgi:2-oxo-3-(phosphooxy)propyl 3-oxoalkanoate synthase